MHLHIHKHKEIVLQFCKFYMYMLIGVKMIKDKKLCMYVYMYVCMYVCMNVCMPICMYVYMYAKFVKNVVVQFNYFLL